MKKLIWLILLAFVSCGSDETISAEPLEENSSETNDEKNNVKERISILDQFTDKIKNFLENAE